MNTINLEPMWDGFIESDLNITAQNQENAKIVGGSLVALVTFCPLYEPNTGLAESKLLPPPATIEESRVVGKWNALKQALEIMAKHSDGDIILTGVFANRGVLLGEEPTASDVMALANHGEAYASALDALCSSLDISYQFKDYEDLAVPIDQFVNPASVVSGGVPNPETKTLNDQAKSIIGALNQFCESKGVATKLEFNRKTRAKIKHLINDFGYETAYWLTAGYLVFDHMIPELVGENGLYLSTERMASIFRIANLTPELNTVARVEISA